MIYLKFTHLTDHLHPNLGTAFSNYLYLLAEMWLSREEIGKRIWALGINEGFDNEGYRKVLEQVLR